MSIKIKVHVLCHRVGTEMSEPELFPTHKQAYKEMETKYQSVIDGYDDDDYYKDETAIYGSSATIVTGGDWEEWTITECEVETSDLHGFASVFEQYLSENYTKYKQFASGVPQMMTTAKKLQDSMTSGIIELRTLLADAISEAAAGKDGGGGV